MTTVELFREFVDRVERVRSTADASLDVASGRDPASAFRAFADEASALVLANLSTQKRRLHAVARAAHRRIGDYDVLAIGGLSVVENAYTRLLAWLLCPKTHAPTALVRQRAWLQQAAISRTIATPAIPKLFLRTSDGVPDLVLEYGDFVVVVEAKTITEEHFAPGGRMQTLAYAPAVAKVLDRSLNSVETVFLTLDGRAGENVDAHPVSHFGVVLSIAEALDGAQLSDDFEAAFRTVLTHFVAHADWPSRDLRRLLRDLGSAKGPPEDLAAFDLKELITMSRLMGRGLHDDHQL